MPEQEEQNKTEENKTYSEEQMIAFGKYMYDKGTKRDSEFYRLGEDLWRLNNTSPHRTENVLQDFLNKI